MAPVFTSMVLLKNRRVIMEVFSPSLRNFRKEWKLQALVLLSLACQIILSMLGNRRKYIRKRWITYIVWSAYFAANSVATLALRVIWSNLDEALYEKVGVITANDELSALWATFLLLHLGGPDTITSYSLEDNETWTRHLLGLLIQTGVAFYIILIAWTGSYISFLAIVIMVAGLIKYGERTWVLRSASVAGRKASTPTPNRQFEFIDIEDILVLANELFKTTKHLFSDDGISTNVILLSRFIFSRLSFKNSWRIIEMELGFMYDVLYTKAIVVYSYWGIAMRFIIFHLTCIALILFCLLHDVKRRHYSKVDLSITFLLLIVAVYLEVYAALVAVFSDQSRVWFKKHKQCKSLKSVCFTPLSLFKTPRWSNSMGQYSFLDYYLNTGIASHSHFKAQFNFLSYFLDTPYISHRNVSNDLKEGIFEFFRDNINVRQNCPSFITTSKVLNRRGLTLRALHHYGYAKLNVWAWSMRAELEQVILVWHIATEICYYLDHDEILQEKNKGSYRGDGSSNSQDEVVYDNEVPTSLLDDNERFFTNWRWGNVVSNWKMSKHVSRYLMYLYAVDPLFQGGLPSRNSFLRTCKEDLKILDYLIEECLIRLSKPEIPREIQRNIKIEICNVLLESSRKSREENLPDVVPAIFRAINLVADFNVRNDSVPKEQEVEQRWRIISGTWMQLLSEAAYNANSNVHARNLKQGGEFLTHVWLLMYFK